MAADGSSKRKTRIRKAPNVPEIGADAGDLADMSPKSNRKLFSRMKIPPNPLTRVIGRVFKLIGKILSFLLPRYFINSWREVRQVTWPSRRETWRLTLAVFIFAIVFGSLVAGIDKGLDDFFKKVILKG